METDKTVKMDNSLAEKNRFVSVVTVALNAEKTIESTIKSVCNQKYDDYEYIILDGGSTDRTIDIAESYRSIFDRKGISFKVFSERDNGIYDAMNKGIALADGFWIIFMNANDRFYSDDTLQKVFIRKYDESVQCIYGDTINEVEGNLYRKKAYPMDVIYYKAPFIHQALFAQKKVLEKYKFDTSIEYAADYDLFVRMYMGNVQFEKINEIVAYYNMNGVSQANKGVIANEWKRIQKKNGLYAKKKIRRLLRNVELRLRENRLFYITYLKINKVRGVE